MDRLPAWFRRPFLRWVDAQDAPALIAASQVSAYVSAGVFGVVLILFASYAPLARPFFHMHAVPALLSYVPALLNNLLFNYLRRGSNVLRPAQFGFFCSGSFFMLFFLGSLVTWSEPPGAVVFSTMYLLTSLYHGLLHRVTVTEPFLAIGGLAGGLVACAFRPDSAHLAIFSIMLPSGVMLMLLGGTMSATRQRIAVESERLRAAVAAEILDRQDAEVRRLAQRLVDVLSYNHDMNNAVMSASLAAEELAAALESGQDPDHALLKELSLDLTGGLEQVQSMLQRVRATGAPLQNPAAEVVELDPVLAAVTSQVAARHPGVRVAVISDLPSGLRLGISGGALSLHRVFHNLVLNACEGNGTQRAKSVNIKVLRNPTGGAVDIRVEDDGPGFAPDLLTRPIEGFNTSKEHGTGLGLYTSERLVRASGGVIDRSNRIEGGASVRVTLPLVAA